MSYYCNLSDLRNESDVEQKLIWPMLTTPHPTGLGYSPAEIFTKANIASLTIDKGNYAKVYRPDYILLIAGLPLVVIEAKKPGEDILEALREARLYCAELNALHPSGVNPCFRIVVTNGQKLVSSPADTVSPDLELDFSEITPSSQRFAELVNALGRPILQARADDLRRKLRPARYFQAARLLGGKTARNEEVGYNDFGVKLSLDFLHVFNPKTRRDRADVVRNAYVASRRREHYADEIDRVIRKAMPSTIPESRLLEDSTDPTVLLRALGRGRELQNKMFLLIGPVGSGKSTFVDYFREVKLDQKTLNSTLWINIDLNDAPVGKAMGESWIVEQAIQELRLTEPAIDFATYEMLMKVFSVEIQEMKKGELARIPMASPRYEESISQELRRLRTDFKSHAKALARFLASERGKLLVLVLDNCDKGTLDEQLTVFQLVKWIQSWLKCLVFLPLRDITYKSYKDRPPLDTVIKDFIFRIESPPFAQVLRKRIRLALDQMIKVHKGRLRAYTLTGGIRVEYPETETGYYLACIYRSLYEHDQLLRRMLVGLAGKNIRKAMEIFLDFCKSGHIGGEEILKIRKNHGDYCLPYRVVTRVLLRLSRRYYNGDLSHIKNLFQCDPSDSYPDHFARFAILRWLKDMMFQKGPTGIRGFHQAERLISELVPLGHDAQRLRAEISYLNMSMCIVTEHQRQDDVNDEDLICVSPAGFAHLSLISTFDYLAACSEDSWTSDEKLAERVADRIGRHGLSFHYSRETTRANASEFVSYLLSEVQANISSSDKYLEWVCQDISSDLRRIQDKVERSIKYEKATESWTGVEGKFSVGNAYTGEITNIKEFGLFVKLPDGPVALLHVSKLPSRSVLSSFSKGQAIRVKVQAIDVQNRKIALGLEGTDEG